MTAEKLANCEAAIDEYQSWYEAEVLGCTSDQWMGLHTAEGFLGSLEEHPDTGAGLYAGFGRSIGLQHLGLGSRYLLSCGCYPRPDNNGFLMPVDISTANALNPLITTRCGNTRFMVCRLRTHPPVGLGHQG